MYVDCLSRFDWTFEILLVEGFETKIQLFYWRVTASIANYWYVFSFLIECAFLSTKSLILSLTSNLSFLSWRMAQLVDIIATLIVKKADHNGRENATWTLPDEDKRKVMRSPHETGFQWKWWNRMHSVYKSIRTKDIRTTWFPKVPQVFTGTHRFGCACGVEGWQGLVQHNGVASVRYRCTPVEWLRKMLLLWAPSPAWARPSVVAIGVQWCLTAA